MYNQGTRKVLLLVMSNSFVMTMVVNLILQNMSKYWLMNSFNIIRFSSDIPD